MGNHGICRRRCVSHGSRASALNALLAAARNGEVDVIVCSALDRLVGRPEDLFALIHELGSIGVDLEVLQET